MRHKSIRLFFPSQFSMRLKLTSFVSQKPDRPRTESIDFSDFCWLSFDWCTYKPTRPMLLSTAEFSVPFCWCCFLFSSSLFAADCHTHLYLPKKTKTNKKSAHSGFEFPVCWFSFWRHTYSQSEVAQSEKKTKLETTTNEGARRKKINKIEMHTHTRERESKNTIDCVVTHWTSPIKCRVPKHTQND